MRTTRHAFMVRVIVYSRRVRRAPIAAWPTEPAPAMAR
jgi:hypothetical protein